MKISPKQALDLEMKLNKSIHSRNWMALGDILYAWRLDPRFNSVTICHNYKVTAEQLTWMKENIIKDLDDNKYYSVDI